MSKFYFSNNEFVMEDYDKQKTFASFLPGIAGKHGIPLWCHYTNRAQAITSFGLRDKNGCILEFYPANTAYRIVDKMGFRTFIKVDGKVTEMFNPSKDAKRKMYISEAMVRLEEIDEVNGLKMTVAYFNLPSENVAGLVRRVSITSIDKDKDIEVVDGLSQLLPTDANEWMLKHQSNLLKSWMNVRMLKNNIAYYFENSIPADEAEVNVSEYGNYYVSIVDGTFAKPVYDANVIFGYDCTLERAINFEKESASSLLEKEQVAADKVPVGFTVLAKHLVKDQELSIDTIIGYAQSEDFIVNKSLDFIKPGYFKQKEDEARKIISDITNDVYTKTAYPLFDNYMRQNYLDNLLRGGYPMFIDGKDKKFVYHLFSRRHGDMEREYNFYQIAPEYYSQGNGNFRDVAQNRRSDSLFHKEVGIYNAYVFGNLIQLDGYNPLGVLGSEFVINDKTVIDDLCAKLYGDKKDLMVPVLSGNFTPGLIVNTMERLGVKSSCTEDEMFKEIFMHASQEICANFGEGYWSDHWTYTLDLVENALAIFPEKKREYLYLDNTYRFFDSPVTVLPRDEKYCINKHGNIRQYGALLDKDDEKIAKCKMNPNGSSWLKTKEEEVVTSNLFGKLLTLCVNKFAILDSYGIGVQMEGNKPGWNDAMNGLPGLFASGVSETVELARIVKFLKESITEDNVTLPKELNVLIKEIEKVYNENLNTFDTWDKVTTALEAFRAGTRFGVTGVETVKASDYASFIDLMEKVLNKGLDKALEVGNGVYPSYLTFNATEYEKLNKVGHYGLPTVKVTKFEMSMLPYFLEAPARSMKYIKDQDVLKKQYEIVKTTDLYDKLLGMYKTSCKLDDCSFEIGRVRAFQKGWLERESNFLHMTYKYLLGLLKAGLYEEFYKEIRTNYVCFMNPEVYGRSTLENSSFLATSNNPDKEVWGEGFVARLSGSTAEMLSMWNIMFFGEKPFVYDNELKLNLTPYLAHDFFDENGNAEAKLLSTVTVKYHNPLNKNTYDKDVKITKYVLDGKEYKEIKGNVAEDLRAGKYTNLDVYLG